MNQLSNSSQNKLNLAHPDLIEIIKMAIRFSVIDFGIAETARPDEKQAEYFAKGLSKLDGVTRKSKHQVTKKKPLAMAVDIFAWVEGKVSYDKEHLSYIAGVIDACTKMLFVQGKIHHLLRWGGNWDMDGKILLDQSFDDRPHYELENP